MANQLTNLRPLNEQQYNALGLESVRNVTTKPTGNVQGVGVTFGGATTDGNNIGILVNYPIGYKQATALASDGMAIDVDLTLDPNQDATHKYFEVSIVNINAIRDTWTADLDVQITVDNNPTSTIGTWQFVKSVVVDDKVKSQ